MRLEDVKVGERVIAAGHDSHGAELRITRRPDAPEMVVRDILVHCTWFVDGMQNSAFFRADELVDVR